MCGGTLEGVTLVVTVNDDDRIVTVNDDRIITSLSVLAVSGRGSISTGVRCVHMQDLTDIPKTHTHSQFTVLNNVTDKLTCSIRNSFKDR